MKQSTESKSDIFGIKLYMNLYKMYWLQQYTAHVLTIVVQQ